MVNCTLILWSDNWNAYGIDWILSIYAEQFSDGSIKFLVDEERLWSAPNNGEEIATETTGKYGRDRERS